MKKLIFLLILIIVTGCQTTKIKNKTYKMSPATVELGSIGQARSMYNMDNNFSIRSFPVLENKIRLDVQILPFNKSINEIYVSKSKNDPSHAKLNYIDSLPDKPKYVTISIMDLAGYANEINAAHNKEISTYIKDTKKSVAVTAVALTIDSDDMAKIKLADTYYLVNNQEKKYTIALYKQGKKIDVIDLKTGLILAYTLGKFCWAVNDRQQWYVGDIVEDNKSCKGNTRSRIKEKEQTNLFKM